MVIDSLTGCMASLGNAPQALFDVQALMRFLARRGVLTIVVVAQPGLLGAEESCARLDLGVLGDTMLLLRAREVEGAVRRSIAPVQKRHGPHLVEVRDLVIQPGSVLVGGGEAAS